MPKRILCLFDIDGTLTKSRQIIEPDVKKFILENVKPLSDIGIVGGSDISKVFEQMGGETVITSFNFVFPENGLVAYKHGEQIGKSSIQVHMGEEKLQTFINFVLKYLSSVILPLKRGTFVEFRTGLINISPIGRSCSQQERDDFEKYDQIHLIRKKMIEALEKEFPDIGLTYSIGGQISFDVYPIGWDKRYCLRYLENEGYDEIHFFGDKTAPGGNDHEIFNDPRVIGHTVTNPNDTMLQLSKVLCSCNKQD